MTHVGAAPAPAGSGAALTRTAPTRTARWRRWTAGVLVVVSCVLMPLSVLAIWVRNEVLDTDRYVANVAPLASNPEVIDAVAAGITNALFDRVDVAADARSVLPSRADFLAAPLAAALREATQRAAVSVLSSSQFRTVWVVANRHAHAELVRALTNTGAVVSTPNGIVTLDLSALFAQVRRALDQRGISVFDSIPINQLALRFELADAEQLRSAQRVTRLLDRLDWALPLLAFVCLGVGTGLSPNRRRTLLRWGVGSAFGVAVIGAGLAFGRSLYLDAVSSPQLPRATAAIVFDTLVRYLHDAIWAVFGLGLVVAFGAWVSGPANAAERLRVTARGVAGGAGSAAGARGFGFGRFGLWVARTRSALRVAAVLAALVVLLVWNHPHLATVLALAVALVLVLAVLEFVARAALTDRADADDSPPVLSPHVYR